MSDPLESPTLRGALVLAVLMTLLPSVRVRLGVLVAPKTVRKVLLFDDADGPIYSEDLLEAPVGDGDASVIVIMEVEIDTLCVLIVLVLSTEPLVLIDDAW